MAKRTGVDILSIISTKRDGGSLSREQIEFAVSGFVGGEIPDYQMSALLMAICIRGMDLDETIHLTEAMIASGARIDLSTIGGVKVDKHSTGGVGDKTTLVAAPIAAAAGVTVAKLSGRGLGHTGGTLDKLEAIPGLWTDLSPAQLVAQASRIGLAIAGQSADIVPADKKIYALRDVTATVASTPLITASVVSKKIAAGADAIVLDVKTGSGAFAADIESARTLARWLVDIISMLGAKAVALVTEMDQPLGCAVGNALEVAEAIDVLAGGGPADVRELSLGLAGRMLALAGLGGVEATTRMAEEVLESGAAQRKFGQMIESQGGDARAALEPEGYLPRAAHSSPVTAATDGVVRRLDALAVGRASGLLGAGRTRAGEAIDPAAGVVLSHKVGDEVRAGETVATMHTSDPGRIATAGALLGGAFDIGREPPQRRSLILEVVE